MPRENVEIVREAYDAYSRGDYDRLAGSAEAHIVVISLEDGVVYGNDDVVANENAGTKPGWGPRQPSRR